MNLKKYLILFCFIIPSFVFGQWDTGGPSLEDKASLGLSGIRNSLGYRIEEIEKHFHSVGKFLGLAPNVSGITHNASGMDSATTAFQLDAGNNAFCAWTLLIGTGDTPVVAGNTSFDPHLLYISSAERNKTYWIQLSSDTTSAADITEAMFSPQAAAAAGRRMPVAVRSPRLLAGTAYYGRIKCPTQDTATLDFYIGLHEYSGN